MLTAGALAGVAGMVEVSTTFGRLRQGISPGYGYMAIVIAALAGGEPRGTLVVAFLFGGFVVGGFALQALGVPQAFVLLLAGDHPLLRPRRLTARGRAPDAVDSGALRGRRRLQATGRRRSRPYPDHPPDRGRRRRRRPLLFAALGEVVAERAGVINLGLEGMMLVGAVVGFLAMNESGSLVAGVAAALAAGAAARERARVLLRHAAREPDHLRARDHDRRHRPGGHHRAAPSSASRRGRASATRHVPLLGSIPWLGEIFFQHHVLVYVGLVLVPVVWWMLATDAARPPPARGGREPGGRRRDGRLGRAATATARCSSAARSPGSPARRSPSPSRPAGPRA